MLADNCRDGKFLFEVTALPQLFLKVSNRLRAFQVSKIAYDLPKF